ncbi:MAG: glycosyltransferase [Candidatus Cloacimonetes bacterium 4572_65]|nr:MAG: glycosyltransferase [Candidatus Cloacimonetes bacterium 4572_65]
MKLSFIIPALNEEGSLKQLHQEIVKNCASYQYEIIFIDDGSNDSTYPLMLELADKDSNVKVVKFRKNFGKAYALQVGFERAVGDVIFTMDADLQDNPIEIPNFLKKLDEGYELVTGWKVKRRDPLSKRLPSKLFNWVTSKTFKLYLNDYNCGFKAYSKQLVKELDIYGEMHRYVPALAHAKGFRVGQIPVHHRAREHGKSKYGVERYLRGFLDLLTVKLITKYNRSPLYLFGNIGAVFTIIGAVLGAYLTVMKYGFGMHLTNRPALFLSILLILVGVQFFSIGLLGELIVNQNRHNNKSKFISIEKDII